MAPVATQTTLAETIAQNCDKAVTSCADGMLRQKWLTERRNMVHERDKKNSGDG